MTRLSEICPQHLYIEIASNVAFDEVDLQYLAVIMIDHVYILSWICKKPCKRVVGSLVCQQLQYTACVHMQHRGTEGQRESHILAVYI